MQFRSGILWAGADQLWSSSDSGRSWQKIKNFPGSAIYDISFYDRSTGLVATGNGVYITTNGGVAWSKAKMTGDFRKVGFDNISNGSSLSKPVFLALEVDGIFCSSSDVGTTWSAKSIGNEARSFAVAIDGKIYAHTDNPGSVPYIGQITISTDLGNSWTNGNSTVEGDCFTISADSCDPNRLYLVNENLLSASDSIPRMYLSTDGAATWQSNAASIKPYYSGALCTTYSGIFAATVDGSPSTDGVCRSLDKGATWKGIGGPSTREDTRTIAAVNNNIIVAIDKDGNIWETNNSGGDSVATPVCCSVPSTLTLSTADETSDTIGGSVNVPIMLAGLTRSEVVEIVLHYDLSNIDYVCTTDGSDTKVDMPGEQWAGRSKLHFSNASSNRPLGYAHFNLFADTSVTPHVTFDSLQVLSATEPCDYTLPGSATSTITPMQGCAVPLLSHLIHFSTLPNFEIVPNPTNGDLTISSSVTIGPAIVEIYDASGNQCYHAEIDIKSHTPCMISLPLSSGNYILTVHWVGGNEAIHIAVVK